MVDHARAAKASTNARLNHRPAIVRGLTGCVAIVELRARRVQILGIERHQQDAPPIRVDLDQPEQLAERGAAIAHLARGLLHAKEREALAAGGEQLELPPALRRKDRRRLAKYRSPESSRRTSLRRSSMRCDGTNVAATRSQSRARHASAKASAARDAGLANHVEDMATGTWTSRRGGAAGLHDGLGGGRATRGLPRALGEQRRALRLPQLDGARAPRRRPRRCRPAARSAAASARRASAWSSSASVAAAIVDGGARELDGGGVLAAPRQRLGAHAAPGDRRLQVVAGERLALVAERLGLGGATLREQRAAEQRRGLRRVDAEAELAQTRRTPPRRQRSAAAASPSSSSMSPAKTSASSSRCVMPSSSTICRDDAIMRRAASVRPRSASSTAWQRSATASTAGAPCVMRSTRTTSRQRPLARVTGLGPQSAASGAPASTALARRRSPRAARRGERAVERGLAGADLAEPRQRMRVHGVRLRLAGGVAGRRERRRPRPRPRRPWRAAPADR